MTLSVPQPPQAVNTVEPESIPVDLRRRPQWVVWMSEVRDDKPTKVPYHAITGNLARTNDPATWATFDDALAQYQRGADGIGFVFSAEDPYVGVDLDNSVDEAGRVKPWAKAILRRLHSYTELSPSGQGLHIIVRGTLPGGGRKRPYHDGKIEMYDRSRFFTVTGRVLVDFTLEPQLRANEPHTLYRELWPEKPALTLSHPNGAPPTTDDDNELLTRAMAARNGLDFDRLWRGDWRGAGYSSQSEADLALCSHLAWWCRGDEARVDRLFRQSGLMRDKWDKRAHADGRTYGQATVSRAAQSTPTFRYSTTPEVITINPGIPPASAPSKNGDCPPLPDEPLAIYDHLAPCAQWLDDYIAFASAAAPMTPRSFHEAAGLFAGSVAIARRAVLRVSTTSIYPNNFFLFVAPSTLFSKTTGLRILTDLFAAAEMQHFLLPQRMTPEAMLQELSIAVPTNLSHADAEARESWLAERPLAAKRGWAIDEASSLFDSLKRDFNTGLLPMLLNLYECPERTTEQTVGRWRVTVHQAYVSFFGAATPAAMADHLAQKGLWHNGLWARFALIVPDEAPRFEFFPNAMTVPPYLIAGLQRVAALFPMPTASLVEIEDPDGARRKTVKIEGDGPPSSVQLASGVWQAWEAYSRATRFTLPQSDAIDEDLYPSYGRLGTHAIKVAMILAAFDADTTPIRVELRHLARAIQIVEGWRASLHRLRALAHTREEETLADRALALIVDAGAAGALTRDIYRPLHISASEMRPILEELERQGLVTRVLHTAQNGRKVETWRRTDPDAKSATGGRVTVSQ